MSSEWQGYDLTEFPELVDPEDTIREALRDTIGDGEGIDDAVMQRLIAKVKADALRQVQKAIAGEDSVESCRLAFKSTISMKEVMGLIDDLIEDVEGSP